MPGTPTAPPRRMTQRDAAQAAGEPVIKLGRLEPTFKPPRIVLTAVEGWGKTSCAAFAPEPAILMAKGETGYETLLGSGLVPCVLTAEVPGWRGLLALLDSMAAQPTLEIKTLALDALGGFERLCHEHVCNRDFEGNWGEKGFAGYQRGFDLAVTDWLRLLQRLDRLRDRGVTVLLLSHVQIRPFKNPLAEDYDRYVADVHHKTWAVTHQWADAVLFGQFVAVINKDRPTDKKGKGIGRTERILCCERRDAYDAKNRYGMPAEIDIPDDPSRTWPTIWEALTKTKEGR